MAERSESFSREAAYIAATGAGLLKAGGGTLWARPAGSRPAQGAVQEPRSGMLFLWRPERGQRARNWRSERAGGAARATTPAQPRVRSSEWPRINDEGSAIGEGLTEAGGGTPWARPAGGRPIVTSRGAARSSDRGLTVGVFSAVGGGRLGSRAAATQPGGWGRSPRKFFWRPIGESPTAQTRRAGPLCKGTGPPLGCGG